MLLILIKLWLHVHKSFNPWIFSIPLALANCPNCKIPRLGIYSRERYSTQWVARLKEYNNFTKFWVFRFPVSSFWHSRGWIYNLQGSWSWRRVRWRDSGLNNTGTLRMITPGPIIRISRWCIYPREFCTFSVSFPPRIRFLFTIIVVVVVVIIIIIIIIFIAIDPFCPLFFFKLLFY